MQTKICIKCNKEKNAQEFRKRRNKCKECERIEAKEYRIKNKQIISEKAKKWREKNKERIKEYNKANRYKYKGEPTEKRKEYLKNYMKKWRIKNKEHIKEYKIESYYKNKDDTLYKFKIQIRNLIYICFKKKGYKKNTKTENILCCDYNTFIEHLLKTFKNNYGYEWNNKEPVHIDHIIPLSSAKTEEDVIKLCHYTNLQLLKEKDNLQKGNKIDWRLDNDYRGNAR